MGSVKALMNENSGLAITFECPELNCSGTIEDHVEDTSFDWTYDRASDGISTAESTVTCPICSKKFVVEVVATGGAKEVHVSGHPDAKVKFHDNTFEYDDYDDFLADYDPVEPHEVFRMSLLELGDLDIGAEPYGSGRQALTKMLYLQYVVILEAYLSDRLIRLISDDIESLLKLVGAAGALRDRQLKLIEVAKDPDFVKKQAKAYLQNLSFHNLTAIAPLYQAILKCDLFANDENRKEMTEIIEMRHHLVHRNGRDSNGVAVRITDLDVQRVKRMVIEMVDRVEMAFGSYVAARPRDFDDELPF